jgi:hypothetical protein
MGQQSAFYDEEQRTRRESPKGSYPFLRVFVKYITRDKKAGCNAIGICMLKEGYDGGICTGQTYTKNI